MQYIDPSSWTTAVAVVYSNWTRFSPVCCDRQDASAIQPNSFSHLVILVPKEGQSVVHLMDLLNLFEPFSPLMQQCSPLSQIHKDQERYDLRRACTQSGFCDWSNFKSTFLFICIDNMEESESISDVSCLYYFSILSSDNVEPSLYISLCNYFVYKIKCTFSSG